MASLSNFSFSQLFNTGKTGLYNPHTNRTTSKNCPKDQNQKSLIETNISFNSVNNTSRFEQRKVLQKLKEQNVLQRIQQTFNKFEQNDQRLKQWMSFKPIKAEKYKQAKQNIAYKQK